MRKILFLGFSHGPYDDRLYYRQVVRLLQHYDDIECVYAGRNPVDADAEPTIERYRVIGLGPLRTRRERLVGYLQRQGAAGLHSGVGRTGVDASAHGSAAVRGASDLRFA